MRLGALVNKLFTDVKCFTSVTICSYDRVQSANILRRNSTENRNIIAQHLFLGFVLVGLYVTRWEQKYRSWGFWTEYAPRFVGVIGINVLNLISVSLRNSVKWNMEKLRFWAFDLESCRYLKQPSPKTMYTLSVDLRVSPIILQVLVRIAKFQYFSITSYNFWFSELLRCHIQRESGAKKP